MRNGAGRSLGVGGAPPATTAVASAERELRPRRAPRRWRPPRRDVSRGRAGTRATEAELPAPAGRPRVGPRPDAVRPSGRITVDYARRAGAASSMRRRGPRRPSLEGLPTAPVSRATPLKERRRWPRPPGHSRHPRRPGAPVMAITAVSKDTTDALFQFIRRSRQASPESMFAHGGQSLHHDRQTLEERLHAHAGDGQGTDLRNRAVDGPPRASRFRCSRARSCWSPC